MLYVTFSAYNIMYLNLATKNRNRLKVIHEWKHIHIIILKVSTSSINYKFVNTL